jgi:hypothetical protein
LSIAREFAAEERGETAPASGSPSIRDSNVEYLSVE